LEGNPMKKISLLAVALMSVIGAQTARAQNKGPAWSADLNQIRQTARTIPGALPLRVNVLKFAESRRTKNFSVKGAPIDPSVQARTVYQVVYPDGYAMIDSGMDQQVHKFFGRGVEEPYFPEAGRQVEKALRGAKSIVMTHEHGDHVAGVIRTPFFAELAPKTTLTKTQVQTLLTDPQMPDIRLTPEMAAQYKVVDYEKYYAFAPGFALIKAPGHTPGSQMIYLVLQSGREYVFAGDVAWHMDGVRQIRGKDAPWIKEDEDALAAELKWLNMLGTTEKNLFVVISHDEEERRQYVERGVLGDGLV
jgi:glyoxylase-like metal-dependent hydrolase (beta-lactamase superfamily II)